MQIVDLLGWGSSVILLATLMRQVYTQWRSRATAGLSKWLFIGQVAASVGYVIYSLLLHNWVYVSSNIAILLTAIVGESLYLYNRRAASRGPQAARPVIAPCDEKLRREDLRSEKPCSKEPCSEEPCSEEMHS